MTYPYGMRGAPAAGGGLGGLPRRSAGSGGSGEIGSIAYFKSNPGDRYLPANGAILDQAAYPDLYAVIGFPVAYPGKYPVNWPGNNTPGGSTSTIISIATNGYGVCVAGNVNGGAYRSVNNGIDWKSLDIVASAGHRIDSIATDGSDTWIMVGDGGYTARSTDNGVTWSVSVRGFAPKSVVYCGAGVWICAGGNAMSKSTDSGATWSPSVFAPISDVSAMASDGNGVVVLIGSGGSAMFRSGDYGVTWSAVGVDIPAAMFRSISTDGNGVWIASGYSGETRRSFDNGQTWLPGNVGTNASLVVANNKAGVWVAAGDDFGNGMAYRSLDNGASWSVFGTSRHVSQVYAIAGDCAGMWFFCGGYSSTTIAKAMSSLPFDVMKKFQVPYLPAYQSAGRPYIRARY